jgi:glycerol-1-phosphate dehydrogenase [NAD(P)+]
MADDDDTLSRVLAGRFPDPDAPGTLQVATRHVVIAPSLAGRAAELLQEAGIAGQRLAVVSDPETQRVLGARVEIALAAQARIDRIVLPSNPHPDDETVERVRTAALNSDALVAVGSGTINDVVKMAAFHLGKPYAVFGTAPSMNGYTSPTAAITVHGHKKSLPAAAARGVFLDTGVLAAAPARMIRAGLGDSLCRCTAQADWLLAHHLRGEPYRDAPFALLKEDEDALLAAPEALLSGERAAMERLARTLVLSGFGMAICGNSKPASQGEHLISHYADMLARPDWQQNLHGEQIAVTTLTMARLQQRALTEPSPRLLPATATEAQLRAHFGDELGETCWTELTRKQPNDSAMESINRRLAADWPGIRAQIASVTRPAQQLHDILRRAGAPTTPADLGWPAAFYRDAVLHARCIRDRWTFLDFAADTGALADAALAA